MSEDSPDVQLADTLQWIEGDGPALIRPIHPEDDMYRFLAEHPATRGHAQASYYSSGALMLAHLQAILDDLGIELGQVGSFLEFACGYGRFTRHLVRHLDPARVTGSDLYRGAVDFQRATFGVDGFYSELDPDDLQIPGKYDVIFVASLFSHLPEPVWSRWLIKLYDALNEDGVLIFSTHGPVCVDWRRAIPASGILFCPMSESATHSTEDYGTTYVTPAWVHATVRAVTGQPVELEKTRGLFNFQDIYVVRRPAPGDTTSARRVATLPRESGFATAYLHAGLPGAAPEVLTHALAALSRDGTLARVAYPLGDPEDLDRVQEAGNAASLADVLRRRDEPATAAAAIENRLAVILAGNRSTAPDLLLSAEGLFDAVAARRDCLREALAQRAQQVRLVLVAQPLRDWAYTQYVRQVEADALGAPFDRQRLEAFGKSVIEGLRKLQAFAPGDAIVLGAGEDLEARLFTALGEDASLVADLSPVPRPRDLDPAELELLREVNAAFENPALAAAIAADFRERWPDANAAFPAQAEAEYRAFELDFLRDYDRHDVPLLRQLRAHLFAPLPPATGAAPAQPDLDAERQALVLQHVLRHGKRLARDVGAFEGIRAYSARLARTDAAFDPIHYLFMHPDLARRGVDPVHHYETHGRREGRKTAFTPHPGA